MESQSQLSSLSTDELKRELTKCEEQLKNLLKVFPHLAGPDTRSLTAQYVGGDEWEALANLQPRITDIKLELCRRGVLPEVAKASQQSVQGLKAESAAGSVETKAAQKFPQQVHSAPDQKPSRPVERGKFCDQVIEEIRRIKNLAAGTGRSVAEIEKENPAFAVWSIRRTLALEDQETFNHPNQWGPPVGYAKMILSKTHDVSKDTITSWVKAWRRQRG